MWQSPRNTKFCYRNLKRHLSLSLLRYPSLPNGDQTLPPFYLRHIGGKGKLGNKKTGNVKQVSESLVTPRDWRPPCMYMKLPHSNDTYTVIDGLHKHHISLIYVSRQNLLCSFVNYQSVVWSILLNKHMLNWFVLFLINSFVERLEAWWLRETRSLMAPRNWKLNDTNTRKIDKFERVETWWHWESGSLMTLREWELDDTERLGTWWH